MSSTVSTRRLLSANATYYVATTGSDSTGDGSSGSPWATIQHAIDYLVEVIDMSTYNVTIQLADGTYTDDGNNLKSINGSGNVTIQGNTSDNTAVIINSSGSNFTANSCKTSYFIQYVTLRTSGSSKNAVNSWNSSQFVELDYSVVDATNSTGSYNYVFYSSNFSVLRMRDIEFSGECAAFIRSQTSLIRFFSTSLTLTGTCNWTTAFVLNSEGGLLLGVSLSITGSATGKRYSITLGSGARTGTSSTTYFPGDTAGTVDSTSYYG